MTDVEKREAARQFFYKWNGKGKEDEDDRSYWIDILERIMGVESVTDHIEFQKKVIVDGNTKRIDAYLPETKVLIEQKTLGIELDKKGNQSGGIQLTPYEQAKRYNDNLPYDEKARWIVTSNFSEIWIYDMNMRIPEPLKISLTELQTKYNALNFLVDNETKKVNLEMEVSLKAGDLVGAIYDAFLKQYDDSEDPEVLKSLNKLCVRIVFCLYAEDAGIFGRKDLFHDYLEQYNAKTARKALRELFKILNQKPEERDKYLKDDDPILAAFPYVNGGLFNEDDIEIPPLTDELLDLILNKASYDFDWSVISPTIFGAVFESTLNPETRRSGGMHYTSIENIHKVIDPLFLDELKAEYESIKNTQVLKTQKQKLKDFQTKLAGLKWFDPACGSGNFLTETYISIRRLENELIRVLNNNQITLGFEEANPIQVSINQFYGIEINDFAVTVAKTALWIAESQMMKETENIVHMELDFLPLKTNAYIVEGNALRIDWETVVPKHELNYIMGNPPFVGARLMSKEQKADLIEIFGNKWKGAGNLDYVSCWYKRCSDYMRGTAISSALVSTNSVSQGESVPTLWRNLFAEGIKINFAYKTFIWDSEASIKAHVHCVIIGFSYLEKKAFLIDEDKNSVSNINGYLIEGPNVFVDSRSKPLCDVAKMDFGNMPNDAKGMLSNFSLDEKTKLCSKYPELESVFHKMLGAEEYINNKDRFCLWFYKKDLSIINKCSEIKERVEAVKNARLKSNREATQKLADYSYLFGEIRQPESNYIIVPRVSSERRRYIPIGFVDSSVIAGDSVQIIADDSLYTFGVLTSNVHMAWMRAVCGRLEMRYRYSAKIVYNNFPWCEATKEQKAQIEKTAQAILDARMLYPDSSLADLYDPLTMPPELKKAHTANDIAVMKAYGFDIKETSESDCVAKLMEMYQKLTEA